MASWYSRNSLMPSKAAPGRNPFLSRQSRGRSSNAAVHVRRSRSMAPQTNRRRKTAPSTSFAPRSRSVPRHRTVSRAPPAPAVQFNGGSSEHLEMSQLSTDESLSASVASSRGNAPGILLGQKSLSVSTSGSTKASGGSKPALLNNERRSVQHTIKNAALFRKPKNPFCSNRAQVTPMTQRHGANIPAQANGGGLSQLLLVRGSQHSVDWSMNQPTMDHEGSHGLSQASFSGSTMGRRFSHSSHYSGPPSTTMSHGSRRGLAQNSHPTFSSSSNQYQGSGHHSLSQASGSTLSTAPSTTTESVQQESMENEVFLRTQAKLERFFQDKMQEIEEKMNAGVENAKKHALLEIQDSKTKALQEIDGKMENFDNQQRAFHNRIASAEEEHIERLEEFETKVATANAQIDNFDVAIANAHDQHQVRKKELDAKVIKLDKMYSKASGLIKSAEQIAESSIISINQARSNLVDAALPFLKEHLKGMMGSLPLSSLPTTTATETSHFVATSLEPVVSTSSNSDCSQQRKRMSKKRTSPATTEQGPPKRKSRLNSEQFKDSKVFASNTSRAKILSQRSTTAKKVDKTAVSSAKKAPKRKARSKISTSKKPHSQKKEAERSPMVPLEFVNMVPPSSLKTFKQKTTQASFSSPAQTDKSCVTPCDKENTNLPFSSMRTPDRKKDRKKKPSRQAGHGKPGKRRKQSGSGHSKYRVYHDDSISFKL